MAFVAHAEIFARFPGLRLAGAVARDVEIGQANPAISEAWRTAWAQAAEGSAYGNAQSHPRVRPWRERFTAMGVSGKQFPSSVEALLRRALKGGEPFSINPLVDFYNAISLTYTVPAGAFDLAAISGPLELRLTRVGDHFTALDEDGATEVPAGEVAYADGAEVLTRHFVWRQARVGLVTPATRALFLISEVLGEVGAQVAEAVARAFETGLQRFFGVASAPFVLDVERPTFAW
jgi:DNA/RNA-binding domain of Phe-tRNA-synthetase-like protein